MNFRSRKGMTLVELIVAVAFTAVVIAAACMVLYVGAKSFQSGTTNAVNQQNCTLAESYLQRYASTAFSVSSSDDKSSDGVVFSLKGNTLKISGHTGSGSSAVTDEIASIDGIARVNLKIEDKVLNYAIVSADNSYTLSGGIVLNNYQTGAAQNLTADSESVLFLSKNNIDA